MNIQKWNKEKKEYEPYSVPKDWRVTLFETDMEAVVHCAECGRKMIFGDGYTSRLIHTSMGMGYTVCEKCYKKENGFNND